MTRIALALPFMLLAGAAAAQDASCPHSDFQSFINAFAQDEALQRQFTAPQIESEYLDMAAEPQPAMVTETISRDALRFPLMQHSYAALQSGAQGLMSWPAADGAQTFTVRGPDSGNLIHFDFSPQPCWTLIAIRDEST
ncbi:MAG: hypothetical protein Q4G36_10900 [Paracoccus sp. (in: a-proteobacteria)]|nr:hypothetical protein [Paracoccus sp. (in: a-proteobacteria)]